MCRYYSYLNKGLALHFNGRRYVSKNGLLDLLTEAMSEEPLYPIIHLEGHDIEVAFTHGGQYGEEHYSFVNGQHTTQGAPTRRPSGRPSSNPEGLFQEKL